MSIRAIVEGHILTRFIDPVQTNSLFPRSDWAYEVDNNDTNQGYDDWLESKIEQQCDTAEDCFDRILHGVPRAFMTDGDLHKFCDVVTDAFSGLRCADDEAAVKARGYLCEEEPKFVFGDTCCILPQQLRDAIGRIAHLGMVAYEGGVDPVMLDHTIHELGRDFGIDSEEIDLARRRQGIEAEDRPAP